MRILALETSCDDTGVAIIEARPASQPKILADLVSSQVKIHAPWGGVVPTLAKREHQHNLIPIFEKALKQAGLLKLSKTKTENSKLKNLALILEREPELLKRLIPFLKKYKKPAIDSVAVTNGPGLEPALWVGVNFARALAFFWNLPIIPINHVEGHLIANWLTDANCRSEKQLAISNKPFPALCLVVSGGHTQLILVKKIGQYKIIGETRDDAAGEAFDKVAKMLNLGYPGGPVIAARASKFKTKGVNSKIKLPRPMLNSGDFDFSFSGLKTAVLYALQKLTKKQIKELTPEIASEFQQAVIDVLVAKTLAAAKKYQVKTILLSGGVAANDALRQKLKLKTKNLELNFLMPPKNYCTDNAAMIAYSAALKSKKDQKNWRRLKPQANWRIA